MNKLHIRYQSPETLTPFSGNARVHSSPQIQKIAASIQAFGFNSPILVDRQNQVIAGHGRLAAAKQLSLVSVPTICVSHLTEAQQRAYVIADNRLAELASWDDDRLKIEFESLSNLDLSFGLEVTGFELAEIEFQINEGASAPIEPALPQSLPQIAISHMGDLWQLGEHLLICGDARDPDVFARLMGTERAQIQFTDPPYNVPIEGHVSGLGSARHREFAMASGEMSPAQFQSFLNTVLSLSTQHSVEGSLHYVCMDWRHIHTLLEVANEVFDRYINLCVWNKANGGMGSLYRSKHELVGVFKLGKAKHINNVQLGQFGRYRTNVWDYPGMTSNSTDRQNELPLHPTIKPMAMIADVLRDASHRGDIVIDPFGGAGSTLLAAETTHRRARLIEIDPVYVDVTIQRWESLSGKDAVHVDTGRTFSSKSASTKTKSHAHENDIEEANHV